MKTVTVYYAYDDTEFFTREECEAYEGQAMYHINQWNRCCVFFDKDMNTIYLPAGMDIEEALDWLNETLQECEYMEIVEQIPDESFKFIDEQLGYVLPENKIGLYMYDYDYDGWVSVS